MPGPTNSQAYSSNPEIKFAFHQLNEDGFGNPMNTTAGALAAFKNKLYVGTRNPQDGAEIWRFDGEAWTQVMSNGFDSDIAMIDHFVEFDGYLYAGTFAMRSEAKANKGGEVWRSQDGESWEKVVEDGFGSGAVQVEVIRFFVHNNRLFASTCVWDPDPSQNGSQLWSSSTGNLDQWNPITLDGFGTPDNKTFVSSAHYLGKIFIGTIGGFSPGWSARIYYSSDGDHWDQVPNIPDNWDGFAVSALREFKDSLYAAVVLLKPGPFEMSPKSFFGRPLTGKVFKCSKADGSDWELAFDGPYEYPDMGIKMALFEFSDHLFMSIECDELGLDIWNTADGKSWKRVASRGIDDPNNIWSYWDSGHVYYQGSYYIGTSNFKTGTEIWRIAIE